MRQIAGYSLWLGHAGEMRDPHDLLERGIEAIVDLALNKRPATLPRELIYCRFPLLDGSGNPPWLLSAVVNTVVNLVHNNVPTFLFFARLACAVRPALPQRRLHEYASARWSTHSNLLRKLVPETFLQGYGMKCKHSVLNRR